MNSNNPEQPTTHRGGHKHPGHMLMAALVTVSTLFAPVAAVAQEPGSTIPDVTPDAQTSVEEVVTADALTLSEISSIPTAPVAVSGGAIIGGESLEVETADMDDVVVIESESTTLESRAIVTYDAAAVAAAPQAESPSIIMHLPFIEYDNNPNAMAKLGFGTGSRNVSTIKDIRSLNAGWYVDWRAQVNPPQPSIKYVQMIRLHQKLDETKVYNPNTGQMCGISLTADRTICPYATPAAYEFSPNAATITAAAKKNPGSIWLIGNEMERVDWFGGRQDEMTPELYAYAYAYLRELIRVADPTAQVAIGGVIQFTPLRQQWLDRVWAQYKLITGVNIDQHIDVFNIHNFVGSERCDLQPNKSINNRMERFCSGMGIPAGVEGTVTTDPTDGHTLWVGSYVGQDNRHLDLETANKQIVNFRTWLKSKDPNNVNKPLIVSEYGALYVELCAATDSGCISYYSGKNGQPLGLVDFTDSTVVQEYMIGSFDAFNSTLKGCALASQTAFDCLLVQQWAWFGLEDIGWSFNPHGALLNASGGISETGNKYASWAKDH